MRKILLADDEKIARDRLRRFIAQHGNFEIAEATDGVEAVEQIAAFAPDLVFLDIQMPGLDGFEVLQAVDTRNFQIVFQTAFDQFALKAFDESACDYLLKPFPRERFDKAFAKALSASGKIGSLEKLMSRLREEKKFLSNVVSRQGAKTRILPLMEVEFFTSQDHCTLAHSGGNEHVIDCSLAYLEENLNPAHFVRCHRNAIVSLSRVKAIGPSTQPHVELVCGRKLPVSRSSRPRLLEIFNTRH